jgi:hypothetical protein
MSSKGYPVEGRPVYEPLPEPKLNAASARS